jgi:hypothetical protein
VSALLATLVIALWALLIMRLVAARASLREGTVGTYLALGALFGCLAGPASQKIFAPYDETGPLIGLVVALVRQAVLLGPVFAMRAFPAIGIADAFLVAFVTGFGYDLAAILLASTNATTAFPGLQWLPPFVVQADSMTIAGYGCWTALVALAYAGTRRFVRRRWVTVIATAVVLVAVSVEAVAVTQRPVAAYRWFAALTWFGWLTPLLTLAAVLALSFYEAQWTQPPPTAGAKAKQRGPRAWLDEWRGLLAVLARGRFAEYRALQRGHGLKRQRALADTELSLSPADPALRRLDRQLRVQQWAADTGTMLNPETARPVVAGRLGPHVRLALGWAAPVIIYIVLPLLPPIVGKWFWNLWMLHEPVPHLGLGLLNAALLAVLLWRYVMAAERSVSHEADDAVSFRAEQLILQTALGVIVLMLIHGRPELLYPFGGPLLLGLRARLPDLQPAQVATFYCLLAVAVTGLTLTSAARWARSPIEERRASTLRRTVQMLVVLFMAWSTNLIYTAGVATVHRALGGALFATFGASGNYATAMVLMVVTMAVAFGLFLLVRPVVRRIEGFLAG